MEVVIVKDISLTFTSDELAALVAALSLRQNQLNTLRQTMKRDAEMHALAAIAQKALPHFPAGIAIMQEVERQVGLAMESLEKYAPLSDEVRDIELARAREHAVRQVIADHWVDLMDLGRWLDAWGISREKPMGYPSIGQRMRLKKQVERSTFIARAGLTGVVDDVEGGWTISVKMDELIPGADAWNNDIVWDNNQAGEVLAEFYQDCELLPPASADDGSSAC
jgi:hypothetical protein